MTKAKKSTKAKTPSKEAKKKEATLITDIKIDWSRPFQVIKHGRFYKKPYHKNAYLFFEKSSLKSKKDFLDALQERVKSWDRGKYSLKAPERGTAYSRGTNTFATFEVRDGKVINLYIG